MTEDILQSAGTFWCASSPVPEGHFAPPQSATGRLRIAADGRAFLDLDSMLSVSGESTLGAAMSRSDVEGAIHGFVFDGSRSVWLGRLRGAGMSSGKGPVRTSFVASRSLVAQERFACGVEPRFRWIQLPLAGYEDWVGRGGIAVKVGRRRIVASYIRSGLRRWTMPGLTVELVEALEGDGESDGRSEVRWREAAYLRLGSGAAFSIEDAINRAGQIEDLLVLLSDCNRGLGFPVIRSRRQAAPVKLFYARSGRGGEATARWHEAWMRFDQSGDLLGPLIRAWLRTYPTYGAGVHLYLGNRRGHPMYPEHRFASLIWGLEALHRSRFEPEPSKRQAAKVERILRQIEEGKDREWAARFLPKTSEPSLATRLQQLFRPLPIVFVPDQLQAFCERCNRRRNELSHFGGPRVVEGYDNFLQDISLLSDALDLLYHAVLLQLVGIPDWVLIRKLVNGLQSAVAQRTLVAAGLQVAVDDAAADPGGVVE